MGAGFARSGQSHSPSMLRGFTHLPTTRNFNFFRYTRIFKCLGYIPVAFEVACLLAALSQPNHIVPLCSGASFACRLHASSIPLGICLYLRFSAHGIAVAYESAWVLATLVQPNHIRHLCSGPSLISAYTQLQVSWI